MSKLCIIGLDALEYNLVEKWDLDVLKQEEYGKVDLSTVMDSGTGHSPLSPVVWTSFMTGLSKDEHNISGFSWNFPFIDIIYKIPTPQIGLEKKILKKLGLKKDFPDDSGIDANTFLDDLGDMCVGVNTPLYDFSFEKKDKVVQDSDGPKGDGIRFSGMEDLSLSERKENLVVYSENVLDETLETLRNNQGWKVFFTYFYWIDGIQHHFYMNKDILKEEYQRACDYVDEIKSNLDDDILVLIISDHGNQLEEGNGNHSKYGFYSLSESRGLKNPKITDFYNFIMSEVNMPTKKDEEEIEDTLRSLGYLE